jgi:hypothetical protein
MILAKYDYFPTHTVCTPTGLQLPTTSQLHLHLPEVRAPSQYLIDMGFQPTLAQQLSKTYMDFVARYRTACQRHFNRAIRGGHVTEYHREVFVILFRRTVQAWDSQIVSIVRAQLCRAGAFQTTVVPERVDVSTHVILKAPHNAKYLISQIRVDDATKVEITARLGLKVTCFTDRVCLMSFVSFYTSNPALSGGDKPQL